MQLFSNVFSGIKYTTNQYLENFQKAPAAEKENTMLKTMFVAVGTGLFAAWIDPKLTPIAVVAGGIAAFSYLTKSEPMQKPVSVMEKSVSVNSIDTSCSLDSLAIDKARSKELSKELSEELCVEMDFYSNNKLELDDELESLKKLLKESLTSKKQSKCPNGNEKIEIDFEFNDKKSFYELKEKAELVLKLIKEEENTLILRDKLEKIYELVEQLKSTEQDSKIQSLIDFISLIQEKSQKQQELINELSKKNKDLIREKEELIKEHKNKKEDLITEAQIATGEIIRLVESISKEGSKDHKMCQLFGTLAERNLQLELEKIVLKRNQPKELQKQLLEKEKELDKKKSEFFNLQKEMLINLKGHLTQEDGNLVLIDELQKNLKKSEKAYQEANLKLEEGALELKKLDLIKGEVTIYERKLLVSRERLSIVSQVAEVKSKEDQEELLSDISKQNQEIERLKSDLLNLQIQNNLLKEESDKKIKDLINSKVLGITVGQLIERAQSFEVRGNGIGSDSGDNTTGYS